MIHLVRSKAAIGQKATLPCWVTDGRNPAHFCPQSLEKFAL